MFNILKSLFGSTNNHQLTETLEKGAFLVDVRTPAEFATGSVKGAINIPLNTLSSHLSKLKNKKNIVVFCQSGIRSGQAKKLLQQNGIDDVCNGGSWANVKNALNE